MARNYVDVSIPFWRIIAQHEHGTQFLKKRVSCHHDMLHAELHVNLESR